MTEENRPIIDKELKERLISLIVMVVMFITIWYMLNFVLLTFITTFIFYHLVKLVQIKRQRWIPVRIPDALVLTVLYAIFIMLLIFASIEFAPRLAQQFYDLANIFINFDFDAVKDTIDPRIAEAVSHINFDQYIDSAGVMLATGVTTVGGFGLNVFLSLILSYLLLLEKNKIRRFGERLAYSRVSFIYGYWMRFGGNFVNTFGKVMKVQVTIALINSIISMILLTILGFPQIASLGIMIFFLGLIPVAGVVISLVPLSIIGFNIGGIGKVVAVILMIILIHTLEAYVLNPKLMSNKTELPVCFIFIILLVGEHYLGVWGLLIGVPIFIFLMNALDVSYADDHKKEKKHPQKHRQRLKPDRRKEHKEKEEEKITNCDDLL